MFKRLVLHSLIAFIALNPFSLARADSSIPPIQRLGSGIPTSIAASPDGKTLAVGSSIGVWLLDAATLQAVGFWDTGFWVDTVAYSSDGRYLRIGARRYDINSGLVDIKNVSLIWLYDAGLYDLWYQSYTSDRRLDRVMLVYDLIAKSMSSFEHELSQQIVWLDHSCSANRQRCATVGVDNFKVVDQDTRTVVYFIPEPYARDIAMSADGTSLYGVSLGAVSSWNLSSKNLSQKNSDFFTGTLNQVLWAPDGTVLASGSAAWDVATAQIVSSQECPTGTSKGCQPYRMAAYHSVYYLDPITGDNVKRFEPHCGTLFVAKLSRDGKLLATSGVDGQCSQAAHTGCLGADVSTCIWDFESFSLLGQIPVGFLEVEFSPESDTIIGKTTAGIEAWHWSSKTLLWSMASDPGCVYWSTLLIGRFHEFERNKANSNCIAIDPQGRYFATFANLADSTAVHLWSMDQGEAIATFEGHTSEITGVSFSPDGTKLAASSLDGTILIWPVP